ncbi:unnamed protein product [Amoebophrya sp. A120]|nr:unnamed protein product [Amoebophrya sp. A120]|eukprot:GSA120T00007102001.1
MPAHSFRATRRSSENDTSCGVIFDISTPVEHFRGVTGGSFPPFRSCIWAGRSLEANAWSLLVFRPSEWGRGRSQRGRSPQDSLDSLLCDEFTSFSRWIPDCFAVFGLVVVALEQIEMRARCLLLFPIFEPL